MEAQVRDLNMLHAGSADRGGSKPKECRQLPEAGKGKETNSS